MGGCDNFAMEKFLPREIEVDIFSRLPVESVVPSKRVCKTWRGVFLDKYFVDVHLRRNGGSGDEDHSFYHKECSSSRNNKDANTTTSKVSFIFLGGPNKSLYYGNYCDKRQQFTYNTLKNNHSFGPDYSLVGSCKGLICLSTWHIANILVTKDPLCVCNPLTGEAMNLPKFIPQCYIDQKNVDIASGFGYAHLTNEYKVVRICYFREASSSSHWEPYQIHVYTLGSGNGWRRLKGDVECLLFADLTKSRGVSANGALYWISIEEDADQDECMGMVAFDLAEERFSAVEAPPCFHIDKPDCYQLQVLGGCLSVVHQRRGEYVDIWSFKKTTKNRNDSQIEGSWSWTREFRIVWEGKLDSEYQPFALTRLGQVLFWYNQTILCLYDAKATSVTEVQNCDDLGINDFQTIPHIHSFVSLKALGEG